MTAGVVIVGAGDHGRVVLDLLRAAGEEPAGFVEPGSFDSSAERMVDGLRVIGDLQRPDVWMTKSAPRFVIALGDNRERHAAWERCQRIGLVPTAAVHPSAHILGGAQIEPGATICAGAVVGVSAWIGPNAIINTAASVDHDNHIGAHATVAPGAHLGGRVRVGEGAFVGIGAAVREGCTIGDWAVIAGGAMAIADVPPYVRVAGVPARPMVERG